MLVLLQNWVDRMWHKGTSQELIDKVENFAKSQGDLFKAPTIKLLRSVKARVRASNGFKKHLR